MGMKAIANRAPVYVSAKFFAGEDTSQYLFTADRDYELVEVIEVHSATDAAGTVQIQKTPSGTAIGSGTDLVGTVFDLGSTADTPVHKSVSNGGLVSSRASRTLSRGDSLSAELAGTLNDTWQGALTLVLIPVTGR